MTEPAIVDELAPAAPVAGSGGRRPQVPPASTPPPIAKPTPGAISLEQAGEPLLGGTATVDDSGGSLDQAQPVAVAWTAAEAAGLICTAVNGEGVILYARLGRLDLFGDHWLIKDAHAACRGFDEAAARLATKYLPRSAGIAGDLSDVITVLGGLIGQILVPKHIAYARDRQAVRAAAVQLPDNSAPGAPVDGATPGASAAPAGAASSSRFRFKRQDADVLATVTTPDPGGLEALGIVV